MLARVEITTKIFEHFVLEKSFKTIFIWYENICKINIFSFFIILICVLMSVKMVKSFRSIFYPVSGPMLIIGCVNVLYFGYYVCSFEFLNLNFQVSRLVYSVVNEQKKEEKWPKFKVELIKENFSTY